MKQLQAFYQKHRILIALDLIIVLTVMMVISAFANPDDQPIPGPVLTISFLWGAVIVFAGIVGHWLKEYSEQPADKKIGIFQYLFLAGWQKSIAMLVVVGGLYGTAFDTQPALFNPMTPGAAITSVILIFKIGYTVDSVINGTSNYGKQISASPPPQQE